MMSIDNRLRSIWESGGVALMAGCSAMSVFGAEFMAHLDLDAIWIDMQHGPVDFQLALSMIQAVSVTRGVPVIRLRSNDPAHVMQMLDAGANTIVCPLVNTEAQCEALVQACLYPPEGCRSFGPYRAQLYGGNCYFDHSNSMVLPIAMIETVEAVKNLDSILSVKGLGGIYIGPSDLTASLGDGLSPLRDLEHPRVIEVSDHIITAAKQHGVPVGFHTPTPEYARMMMNKGVQLVWAGADTGLIRAGVNAAIQRIKRNDG